MARRPANVGTYPNNHGGLDIKMVTGPTVRTAFEDGTDLIYVLDPAMRMTYDIRLGHLTPESVWEATLKMVLTTTFEYGQAHLTVTRSAALVKALRLVRDQVVANWRTENGL